jgi:hypothetical protein
MQLMSVTSSGAQEGDDTIDAHHSLSSSSPAIAAVPDRLSRRAGTDEVLNADRYAFAPFRGSGHNILPG